MVGRGQPPKKPEDKREQITLRISQNERKLLEEGRDLADPTKGLATFIRESAIEKAVKLICKK